MIQLKMMEEKTSDPQLNVLNIINTCWLSLSNVISNLHQILDSIIAALFANHNNSTFATALYEKNR